MGGIAPPLHTPIQNYEIVPKFINDLYFLNIFLKNLVLIQQLDTTVALILNKNKNKKLNNYKIIILNMSLIIENYEIAENKYPIYMFTDENDVIWLKLKDVVKILEYADPKAAYRLVHKKYKCCSRDLNITNLPPYWKPDTVMATESGIYELLSKSEMPRAQKFKDWLFDDVLPTISRTGAYISPNIDTNQITTLMEMLKQRDQMMMEYQKMHMEDRQLVLQGQNRMLALSEKLISVAPRIAIMTTSEEHKHCLRIYKKIKNVQNTVFNNNMTINNMANNLNEYRFIRVQKINLTRAIKNIKPDIEELVFEKCNIPNGTNILNRAKEIIPPERYTSRDNVIVTDVDVVDIVQKILCLECL